MMEAKTLLQSLAQFCGTNEYHHHSARLVLTDGAKYLADNAECYWLFDIVASILPDMIRKRESFLSVRLIRLEENRAVFTVEDGNGKVLYTQNIEYTDFPLSEYDFFVIQSGGYYVALLKGEY